MRPEAFARQGRGQTLLVTGGAGFVGSNLACAFRAAYPALDVVCLDNLRRRGSELALARLREAGVRFVHGDIRSPDDLARIEAVDVLLECSAEPSVLAGYGPERPYVIQTNLLGTLNCLELALRRGAALVFLSTSRVYPIDSLERLPWREEDTRYALALDAPRPGVSERGIGLDFPLDGARSLYGATKLCSELLIREYAGFGLRAVVNRCGVVAGPWQLGRVDQGVATHWLLQHCFDGTLRYIGYGGSGKQVRDFLHVDDLFDLVELELARLDEVAGETFHAGGGAANSLSLLELTGHCQKLTGHRLAVGREAETRAGDVRFFVTDTARTEQHLGWRPRRGVERILADIHTWIESHRDAIRAALLDPGNGA